MSVKITWSLSATTNVSAISIERADVYAGPYVEIQEVAFPATTYTDPTGDTTKWYKLRIKFEDLSYGDYTLPKQLQILPVCKVFGYVSQVDGSALNDEDLYFTIYAAPTWMKTDANAPHIGSEEEVLVQTMSDGYFEIDLVRGAKVTVKISETGEEKEFTVPDIASKSLYSILYGA